MFENDTAVQFHTFVFGRQGFVGKLLQVSIVGDNNQARLIIQLGPAPSPQDDDAKKLQGHCKPMGP